MGSNNYETAVTNEHLAYLVQYPAQAIPIAEAMIYLNDNQLLNKTNIDIFCQHSEDAQWLESAVFTLSYYRLLTQANFEKLCQHPKAAKSLYFLMRQTIVDRETGFFPKVYPIIPRNQAHFDLFIQHAATFSEENFVHALLERFNHAFPEPPLSFEQYMHWIETSNANSGNPQAASAAIVEDIFSTGTNQRGVKVI